MSSHFDAEAVPPAPNQPGRPALEGHTAVVTGASSGIGQAISLALAQAGVSLCLVGRDVPRLEATASQCRQSAPLVLTAYCELTDDAAVRALPAALPPAFAQLDFLVHAAGTVAHGQLAEHAVEEFDHQFALNVRAPYLLTQVLLPRLRPHASACVVFINSMAALIPKAVNGQYAASKAALKAVADSLREELIPAGVRVLSVLPGKTATPMLARLCAADGELYDPSHYIQPADLAELVLSVLRLPATTVVYDLPVRPVRPVSVLTHASSSPTGVLTEVP